MIQINCINGKVVSVSISNFVPYLKTLFMKKLIALILPLFIAFYGVAHEGMWIPSLLKALEDDMQAQGMKLTAEEIYSINQSSLKDAIVHFGGGCTAEVVSKNGLILTNHHCGYSQIQSHSSTEHNYLKDGFWAMDHSQELKNPGLTATFIVRIEDVTDQVNGAVKDGMDKRDAFKAKYEKGQALAKEATEGTGYKAVVKAFNYGNSYYMIVTETFNDVRLVGAPPSDIGKFGGDTDNWVWPRHTGDFSVFRIYADKENNPADVSDDNVPYSPKKWLPVSMEGLEQGDFTMVFGFPGTTNQYLTSYAVDTYINKINPARISMREKSLAIIDVAMKRDEATYIKYASKQSRISNAYKKWVGQNLGLKKKDALGKKETLEAEYLKRVPRDGKYKNVLQDLKTKQAHYDKYDFAVKMFVEIWYYGPEIIRFSNGFENIGNEDFAKDVEKKKKNIEGYFKNYDEGVDKQIFAKLLKMYVDFLEPELRPDVVKTIDSKFGGDYEAYADFVFKKSNFTSKEKTLKLLSASEKKFKKMLLKDPAYQLSSSIYFAFDAEVKPDYYGTQVEINDLMKRFVAAQMEYFPEKTFWADANSTLRLTYGKAEGTLPRDGMKYTWYTTLDGIIEKNNTGNDDFHIPARLRELWEKKEYGRYATDGELRVCFLGSNHTTGGNSGSPVINGEGHLVGINFDRSWESTMSDIMFDPDICRNIMVDIKYVLWVMDVYAGAGHLVEEMTLVDAEYREDSEMSELKEKERVYSNRLRDVVNDVYALMGRADLYLEMGEDQKALADMNKAIEIDPKNVSAINMRAAYYADKKMYKEAMNDITKSLKLSKSDNLEAYFTRGLVYAEQDKFKEAIADFDKVIDLDYTFNKAYYNRGLCYAALGDVDEACRNFEIAKLMGDQSAEKMHYLNCEFGAW